MGGKKNKNDNISKQELKAKEVRRNLNKIREAENGFEVLKRICTKQGHNVPTNEIAKHEVSRALTDTRSAISVLGLR